MANNKWVEVEARSIDDAIKAILLSIRNKNIVGKSVNIGSGNPIRLKDIIQPKIKKLFQKCRFFADLILLTLNQILYSVFVYKI